MDTTRQIEQRTSNAETNGRLIVRNTKHGAVLFFAWTDDNGKQHKTYITQLDGRVAVTDEKNGLEFDA